MIYSPQQDRLYSFLSQDSRNNRIDAQAYEVMSKEFSGVARTPGDAASQRHIKVRERNINRSGQHIVGVMENAASKTMFLYTVGNAMDGGAELLCRGVHVSKTKTVARCMNMLRRRRKEGHPVFAGQRAGSEDGSDSYSIIEPADAARVRKNVTCLATKIHGHSRYPLLELVATGSQQEMLAQGLVEMGLEGSFEDAARKVAYGTTSPCRERPRRLPPGRAGANGQGDHSLPAEGERGVAELFHVRGFREHPRQEALGLRELWPRLVLLARVPNKSLEGPQELLQEHRQEPRFPEEGFA